MISNAGVIHSYLTSDSKKIEGYAAYLDAEGHIKLKSDAATAAMGVVSHLTTINGKVIEADLILLGAGIIGDVAVKAGTYAAGDILVAGDDGLWAKATEDVGAFAGVRVTASHVAAADGNVVEALI